MSTKASAITKNIDNNNRSHIFKKHDNDIEGEEERQKELDVMTASVTSLLSTDSTSKEDNQGQDEYDSQLEENDISNMDACSFTLNGKRNPVTGNTCKEAFTNMKEIDDTDMLVKVFYGSLGIFGLYLLCKFMEKNKNIKF